MRTFGSNARASNLKDFSSYTPTNVMLTLLNDKINANQILTNVPANAVFTDSDTIYVHPSSHPISMIAGLQTSLDGKQANLSASTGVFLTECFVLVWTDVG